MSEAIKIVAKNKKAFFNYAVLEKFECGIVLEGSEVKSIRMGSISFPDSFAEIEANEVWLKNFHIAKYPFASVFVHNPDRSKKLLLKREEIKRLQRKINEKGFTLVPLEFYLKNGKVKISLGLCRGKKQFDKSATIKERDIQRDMRRTFRSHQ